MVESQIAQAVIESQRQIQRRSDAGGDHILVEYDYYSGEVFAVHAHVGNYSYEIDSHCAIEVFG